MKLYKLTNQNGQTYGQTQWGENVEHTALGGGPLCTDKWLHAYRDPILALLMNPIHANVTNPQLWEAEGEIGMDDGTKVGCTKLTTIRQLPVSEITTEQHVRFAILSTKAVYHDPAWNAWADAWLSRADRTRAATWAAAEAAEAAEATAWAAARAAARATEAAVEATWAATWAATRATEAAAEAAEAATWAAARATEAAKAATWAGANIDLVTIAHQAVREELQT